MATIQLETVCCPWCLKNFDVDPALGALPYKCPNPDCGKLTSLLALRQRGPHPDALSINRHLIAAATSHICECTMPFIYRKDAENKVGSGTLVNFGGRCLVATAGHTIPAKPERVKLVPMKPPESVERLPRVINMKSAGDVDVGLVEIETDAPQLLGVKAITIDEIADLSFGRPAMAWLVGQPEKQQTFDAERRLLSFQRLCLTCEPTDPMTWEAVREQVGKLDDVTGTLAADIHVLIYYDFSEPTYWPLEYTRATDTTPEPPGMSGGGLWQCREATGHDAIWSPDRLCLFAIQSSWPKRGQFLKAIQVIHWLRLVATTYPELCSELQKRFPRLANAKQP